MTNSLAVLAKNVLISVPESRELVLRDVPHEYNCEWGCSCHDIVIVSTVSEVSYYKHSIKLYVLLQLDEG